MDSNDRIKGLVKELYGSYEKLGQEIGVSTQAISEIINGRSRGATGRYAVARALGTTVEDLWPETEGAPAA